jgi:hypothetical protein
MIIAINPVGDLWASSLGAMIDIIKPVRVIKVMASKNIPVSFAGTFTGSFALAG